MNKIFTNNENYKHAENLIVYNLMLSFLNFDSKNQFKKFQN